MRLSVYILLILYNLIITTSITVTVNDEESLVNTIYETTSDSLIINIKKNVNIKLSNEISIYEKFEKISFIGEAKESSIITFNDLSLGFSFNDSIQEVIFKNISINGTLKFTQIDDIEIDNVILNGSFIISENANNNTVKLNNLSFTSLRNSSTDFCFWLHGNVIINNSTFYGSSFCNNSVLYYNGENQHSLNISNSYFNGMYSNSCLDIIDTNNFEVSTSLFENGYTIAGGGSIRVTKSKYVSVDDSKFNNSFSENNGGVFFIYNVDNFISNNIGIYNTTAIRNGSAIYMNTEDHNGYCISSFTNVTIKGVGINNENIIYGGLVATLDGSSFLKINNLYGEKLYCGNSVGAFVISGESKIDINDIELHEVYGNRYGGVLFNSYSEKVGSQFSITNGYFTDFHQIFEKPSATLLWATDYIEITLKNCTIKNLYGKENSYISFYDGKAKVTLKDVSIDGIYASSYSLFTSGEANGLENYNNLLLDNVTLSNIKGDGVIVYSRFNEVVIRNSNFFNIGNNFQIADLKKSSSLTISNSIFDNFTTYIGFRTEGKSHINLTNCTIKNSVFSEGFIHLNNNIKGIYNIKDSLFYNNTGNNGIIVKVDVDEIDYQSNITFSNSEFKNNYAMKYGGIIYSKAKSTNLYVNFDNCTFENNDATSGKISYSLTKYDEAKFSNDEELKKISDTFVTNPTRIKLTSDSKKSLSLLSGDNLSSDIKFKLYDDYDNECFINSDLSTLTLDEFIFFKIEINDTYNTKLMGQYISHCWVDDECTIPNAKIIGNSGDYELMLTIIKFGSFNQFENNSVKIDLTIRDCAKEEANYLYQNKDDTNIKSCYLPVCSRPCMNNGVCVNDDVCDCSNSYAKGQFCDEYYKLERMKTIDIIIRVIASILLIMTILLIIGIIIFRNELIIKSANIKFQIIILIGIIFNFIYIWSLTKNKSSKRFCIGAYFYKNMGFSLVFGSILVKTYQIYKIISFKKFGSPPKEKTMFTTVFSMVFIHIIILGFWIIKGDVESVLLYNNNHREYYQCYFPKTKSISTIFNIIILFAGYGLSYATRGADKKFKEQLIVPVYTYVLFTVIMEIIDYDKESVSILVQDFFNAFGTIINSMVILYYIYITKFYSIFIQNGMFIEQQNESKFKALNNKFYFEKQKINNPTFLSAINSRLE